METNRKLLRSLGLGYVIVVVIGNIIGSGVYKKIAPMAAELHSSGWVLIASATVAENEAATRLAWLQQNLDGGFQHGTKLAQLRKKQAALDEELQASKGETMAVGDETSVE